MLRNMWVSSKINQQGASFDPYLSGQTGSSADDADAMTCAR
jgi:hypothetical protein